MTIIYSCYNIVMIIFRPRYIHYNMAYIGSLAFYDETILCIT